MLRGQVDEATRDAVSGWAWETEQPHGAVSLVVSADGVLVARVVARQWRADLEAAGIGNGRHSFTLNLGASLSVADGHVVTVQRESDGQHLEGSPFMVAPVNAFDHRARTTMTRLLESGADTAELETRITWLTEQTSRLLQRRADQRSGLYDRRQRQFAQRWPTTGSVAAAGLDATVPRALVIDQTAPRLGHDAGSNVILSHMASLRRLGYAVVFVPADMGGRDPAVLEALGILVSDAPWYGSVEEVLRRDAGLFDVVYLHRIAVAARFLPLVRFHLPKARVIFAVADLSYLRLSRQAGVEDRPALLDFARQRRAGELMAAHAADAVLTHSSFEAALLAQEGVPAAKIFRALWSVPVQPEPLPGAPRGVAFIGGFGHEPNIDAAFWLVNDIMPLVWAEEPGLPCLLAGSEMPASVRALAQPGVEILGEVPALGEVFARVRVTVAPLRSGAGVKGKVVDSLAAGRPCICTSIAAEGLDLPQPLQWLIANDADGLARRIAQLHQDGHALRSAATAGLAFIADAFSDAMLDAALSTAVRLFATKHTTA